MEIYGWCCGVTKNGWLAGEQSGDRGYQAYIPVEVVTGKMKRPEVYSRPEYCSVDLETYQKRYCDISC